MISIPHRSFSFPASPTLPAGLLMLMLCTGPFVAAVAADASGRLPFSQRLIDRAAEAPLIDFEPWPLDDSDPAGSEWKNGTGKSVLETGLALCYLAVIATIDAEARATDGTRITDRLLAQLQNLSKPGREPRAAGGIYGWAEGPVAVGLALARRSPPVWNNLNAEEKDRLEWILRALAVAAHWSLDCSYLEFNDEFLLLDGKSRFAKAYAPNHWWGQTAVLLAAAVFFDGREGMTGGAYLDSMFTGFSRAAYVTRFTQYGFNNILDSWRLPDSAMDDGMARRGPHDFRLQLASGKGYYGAHRGLGDLLPYLESPWLHKGFGAKVADRYPSAHGTLLSGRSPDSGAVGAISEFDRGSSRSSARYAFDCWRNLVPIRVLLQLSGRWTRESGTVGDKLDQSMRIGSEDLIYKLKHGYIGDRAPNVPYGPHWQFGESMGYDFVVSLWRDLVAPDRKPNRLAAKRIEAESFDYSGSGLYDASMRIHEDGNTRNVVDAPGGSNRMMTAIRDKEHAWFHDVDFGKGSDSLELRIRSTAGCSLYIDIWSSITDDTLPMVRLFVSKSADFRRLAIKATPTPGVRSLHMRFTGDPKTENLADLDWFRFFNAGTPPVGITKAISGIEERNGWLNGFGGFDAAGRKIPPNSVSNRSPR